jgi:hypothetical protein
MSMNNKQNDVLKAILSVGAAKPKKTVYMARFNSDFEVQAIGMNDLTSMQEQATFTKGKGNKQTKEIDQQVLTALMIVKGCVVPNWEAPEITQQYGSAVEAVQNILLIGELQKLSDAISEVSGFGDSEGDIEEIKN